MRGKAWRLFLLLFGLAVGLLLAELILRLADRQGWIGIWQEARTARQASIWMASPHPGLLYQHRPDYVKDGIRWTERHGILRPHDASEAKPPGTFRITLLGDSVAAGLKLPYEARLGSQLETKLTAALQQPVEVLNFAVNGYDTAHEAALLAALASRFESDLLLLQYCVNDLRPSATPSRWFVDPPRSYFLDLLTRFFDRRFVHGYPPAAYWQTHYQRDQSGWRSVVRGFEEIAAHAREQQTPALLLIYPALSQEGWWAGNARGRHRMVTAAGEAAGFVVIDLLPAFADYAVEDLRFEPWDTFHPNALGHEVGVGRVVAGMRRILPGNPAAYRSAIAFAQSVAANQFQTGSASRSSSRSTVTSWNRRAGGGPLRSTSSGSNHSDVGRPEVWSPSGAANAVAAEPRTLSP